VIRLDDMVVDLAARPVIPTGDSGQGPHIWLMPTESHLLEALPRRQGRLLSRQ
jgi:hypothetical protein